MKYTQLQEKKYANILPLIAWISASNVIFIEPTVSIFTKQGGKSMWTLEFNNSLTLLWQQWPPADVSCNCGSDPHDGQKGFRTFRYCNILVMPSANRPLEVMPKHLIRVEVSTLTWPLQKAYFSFVEADILLCFGSLSCCIIQSQLSFQWQADDLTFSYKMSWFFLQHTLQPAWGCDFGTVYFPSPHTVLLQCHLSTEHFASGAEKCPGVLLWASHGILHKQMFFLSIWYSHNVFLCTMPTSALHCHLNRAQQLGYRIKNTIHFLHRFVTITDL